MRRRFSGQRALQDIDDLITFKTVDMRRFFRQYKRGWRDQACLWEGASVVELGAQLRAEC